MKKFSIRWLDNVNKDDIYSISYNDKILPECVLTTVQLETEGSNYKLKENERHRIDNLLRESIDAELGKIPSAESPEVSHTNKINTFVSYDLE